MNATDNVLLMKPLGLRNESGWVGPEWLLEGYSEPGFVLRYAVPEDDAGVLCDADRGDHAVAAVLLWAMHHGKDIVVQGKVSSVLLDGLETMQAIWLRWRPYRYRRIVIRADEQSEVPVVSLDRKAVFAFSGGVDGAFAFFRHFQGREGRNGRQPGAAMLVHGMDIPLDRPDYFDLAVDRVNSMLQGTGVPVVRMRTNARRLNMNWEDCFGLHVGASFLMLQKCFGHGVLGSGSPYDTLHFPWGSTPLTDPLMSTGAMRIEHDGCAFDRTDKVKWLAENTDVSGLLRVCWAGKELHRNCGHCEKCLRTMLNFWAAKANSNGAFPVEAAAKMVLSIRLLSWPQMVELKSILAHAKGNNLDRDPIFFAIRFVIFRYLFGSTVKFLRSKFKNALSNLLK